jgi:phosphoglycerate dehydrogenase-like enzyme
VTTGACAGADRGVPKVRVLYPAYAPLAHHPKVIATAHNAALTTSYFRRAARALGEALAAQLDSRRPPHALNAPKARETRTRTTP